MTKILYSPGYGAGWSTWMSGSQEFIKWALTYQPIIDALERGEKLNPEAKKKHPALVRFLKESKEKFGVKDPYLGGAGQLQVYEVSGPFRIDEYDGRESVIEASQEAYISI